MHQLLDNCLVFFAFHCFNLQKKASTDPTVVRKEEDDLAKGGLLLWNVLVEITAERRLSMI